MSNKRNGVKWSKLQKAKQRRYNALQRLEKQLKEDYKVVAVPGEKEGQNVALTEKDKARITKEIEILKSRI